MEKIKFLHYVWLNSKVTLFFAVFVFPMFMVLASILDGRILWGFLWPSLFLVLVTLIGDYISWKKL